MPSWVPPGLKQAPMPLLRVQALVNTRNLDARTDLLAGGGTAASWLREAGLLGPDAEVTEADLRVAREVRESIRGLLIRNAGDEPGDRDDLSPLRDLAELGELRLDVAASGAVELAPGPAWPLTARLLGLLLTIRDAQQDGTWPAPAGLRQPGLPVGLLRPVTQPPGVLVRDVQLRQPDEDRSLRARRRAADARSALTGHPAPRCHGVPVPGHPGRAATAGAAPLPARPGPARRRTR